MNKRANLYFAALLGAIHVQVLLKTLPENLSSAQPSESKVRPVEP